MTSRRGACWVCGTETTSTCGPRVRAGNAIFFCGPEHPEIVWKHHKRVCGQPGFKEPYLTQSEVDFILSIANRPTPSESGFGPPLAASLRQIDPDVTTAGFLAAFMKDASNPADADQWSFLNFIRMSAGIFLLPGVDEYVKSWSQPFESIAKYSSEMLGEILPLGVGALSAWTATLFHRLLILLSVWPGPIPAQQQVNKEQDRCMKYTKKALFDVLQRQPDSVEDGKVLQEAKLCLGDLWGLYEEQPRIAPPGY